MRMGSLHDAATCGRPTSWNGKSGWAKPKRELSGCHKTQRRRHLIIEECENANSPSQDEGVRAGIPAALVLRLARVRRPAKAGGAISSALAAMRPGSPGAC
jgi:hypothetical protein